MTVETIIRDEEREIAQEVEARIERDNLTTSEVAPVVLSERFPDLPDVVLSLATRGLYQVLGYIRHKERGNAMRGDETKTDRRKEGSPAVHQPTHLAAYSEMFTQAMTLAILDKYKFVGAEGREIRLGDAQYDDLDLRARTERQQARTRDAVADVFEQLRDVTGKKRRVRDVPTETLTPILRVLRDAMI